MRRRWLPSEERGRKERGAERRAVAEGLWSPPGRERRRRRRMKSRRRMKRRGWPAGSRSAAGCSPCCSWRSASQPTSAASHALGSARNEPLCEEKMLQIRNCMLTFFLWCRDRQVCRQTGVQTDRCRDRQVRSHRRGSCPQTDTS